MPAFDSEDALSTIKARGIDLPFIIVSGHIGEDAAVAAMRAGAHGYVPKDRLPRLGVVVRGALKDAADRAANGQRERDLEAIHAVAFAAGSMLDASRLAQFAVERAGDLLRADNVALYWWNSEPGVLERIARTAGSEDRSDLRLIPGEGLVGVAFARRETIIVDDYRMWLNSLPGSRSVLASAVATPLFIGDRAIGIFFVGSLTPRRFSPDEVRALSVLGAQVGPPIETSHLLAAAQHAAHYDALTGLPNRVLFVQRLRMQIKACTDGATTFAILYADLDGFREVNDALGYDGGNLVLQELGVRLRRISGIGDAVGRFGADEFGMILSVGSGIDEGRRAAEASLEFLREPFQVGQPVHLAVSIGIAVFPEHGRDAELLLRRAELAMFAAKHAQTRYRVYSGDLDPQGQKRLALAAELRHAIGANELALYYQPQIDCRTGSVVGAEALLRWRHPRRGLIAPLEFIPLAEQSGLILQVTPWVIEGAVRQLRSWREKGIDLRLAVNVAMRNLQDPSFLATVENLIAGSGMTPRSLTLEITEGTIMFDAQRTLGLLQRFREMDLGVAIDDFGTGYSSLSYLSRLPVDEIKIDKSFVMALEERGNRAIVEAVIELGRAFGVRVVAEGVKDHATWEAIVALRCPFAQGYYWSAPVPASEFDELLAKARA
jgi:diguanylate cyclase (GGDEF)-like protein